MILMSIILFLTFHSLIAITSFGQQINTINNSASNTSVEITAKITSNKLLNDTIRPSVNITYPEYPPTVTTGKLIIQGTANDSGSGIRNVSADVHTFPFDGHFTIPLASRPIPVPPNNWSHWSVPLIINNTDSYRVVITAIDNAGNANYAETTINAALGKNNSKATNELTPRIAFVRPTFTEAAYQEHGFYRFYFKYGFPPFGKNITTDLEMLTVKTPKSVSEFPGNDIRHLSYITSLIPINGTELGDVSQNYFPVPQKFWLPFIEHVKKGIPNAMVTVMRDEDVHDGHIFYGNNKTNSYDILLLFHSEYVTHSEYDNLKQFVNNGGTVVFIDANIFYAEVSYNKDNHTITLVKGHDWKFDGRSAKIAIPERWHNETKEWVGSNFLISDIKNNITFANNPYNYTHFEEQFVNNPKDKIITNYGVKFPRDYVQGYLEKKVLPAELHLEEIPIENITVATYSLDYGKGKVILLGLSGRLLSDNPEFMKFFDNVILPKSLCPKFEPCWYYPSTNYDYGCTNYDYYGYHCDPISNDFENYQIHPSYTKIASATIYPNYTNSKYGKGIFMAGAHRLESLRANILNAYNASQFSVYLSFQPDKYNEVIGNAYTTLVSYKSGIYRGDQHTSGWEIEFVPNNSTSMKKVHFTVFNTKGHATSSQDIDIPIGKFSELAGTFDGKAVKMFVDGVLKSETPFVGNYSGAVDHNNFFKAAGDAYCSCYLANGILDEIRYYNYSLNSQQVKQINNHSSDILGKGLVGYWKFDQNLKDGSQFKNNMFYNTPVASMAFAPDGRLFYTEKNSGNIRIMVNNTTLDRPFASIPNIHVDWEQGLLGLAIDSKFKENHFVYVYYNYKDTYTGKIYAKIVRLTDDNNSGKDQTVILDKIPASSTGFHTGGALAFNKVDDKLYVTVGDAINARSAQNISSLNGKTLRINRDGTIPDDNPFPNSPVYTYGHRNMYGISFDDHGHGIVTEPGSALYDEINSQIKGGNYGWRTLQPANKPPNPLANDSSIKPIRSYYVSENPTQATYYNGNKFPELKGKFIVGSFRGDLYAYKISENGKKLLEEIKMDTSLYPSVEVISTAVSPNGDIYFGAYDIFKLDKLDLTSKKQETYPIQINATNLKVSGINYLKSTSDFTVDLIDIHAKSTLSIKFLQAFTEEMPIDRCNFQNSTLKKNNLISSEFIRDIQKDGKNDVIKVQLQDDAPENLQLKINPMMINCF